jgi:hypothetical protein
MDSMSDKNLRMYAEENPDAVDDLLSIVGDPPVGDADDGDNVDLEEYESANSVAGLPERRKQSSIKSGGVPITTKLYNKAVNVGNRIAQWVTVTPAPSAPPPASAPVGTPARAPAGVPVGVYSSPKPFQMEETGTPAPAPPAPPAPAPPAKPSTDSSPDAYTMAKNTPNPEAEQAMLNSTWLELAKGLLNIGKDKIKIMDEYTLDELRTSVSTAINDVNYNGQQYNDEMNGLPSHIIKDYDDTLSNLQEHLIYITRKKANITRKKLLNDTRKLTENKEASPEQIKEQVTLLRRLAESALELTPKDGNTKSITDTILDIGHAIVQGARFIDEYLPAFSEEIVTELEGVQDELSSITPEIVATENKDKMKEILKRIQERGTPATGTTDASPRTDATTASNASPEVGSEQTPSKPLDFADTPTPAKKKSETVSVSESPPPAREDSAKKVTIEAQPAERGRPVAVDASKTRTRSSSGGFSANLVTLFKELDGSKNLSNVKKLTKIYDVIMLSTPASRLANKKKIMAEIVSIGGTNGSNTNPTGVDIFNKIKNLLFADSMLKVQERYEKISDKALYEQYARLKGPSAVEKARTEMEKEMVDLEDEEEKKKEIADLEAEFEEEKKKSEQTKTGSGKAKKKVTDVDIMRWITKGT